jgi:hypothetical protein
MKEAIEGGKIRLSAENRINLWSPVEQITRYQLSNFNSLVKKTELP